MMNKTKCWMCGREPSEVVRDAKKEKPWFYQLDTKYTSIGADPIICEICKEAIMQIATNSVSLSLRDSGIVKTLERQFSTLWNIKVIKGDE